MNPGSRDPRPRTPSPEEILGFERGAKPTEQEIDGAYRRLVLRHHPDKEGGSTDMMARINHARDELKRRLERTEKEGEEEDMTLESLIGLVERSETIEAMKRVFDLFTLYTEEQLLGIHLPTRIDNRAIYIFGSMAAKARSKDEARKVFDDIKSYSFFTSEARAKAVAAVEQHVEDLPEAAPFPTAESKKEEASDHAARQAFLARVRGVTTPLQLENLLKELYQNTSFDDHERSIVRTQITRKHQKLQPRKNP